MGKNKTQADVVSRMEFRKDAALAERKRASYSQLVHRPDVARAQLRALECGETFRFNVSGPYDDGEGVDLVSECVLPVGHDSSHSQSRSTAASASPDYLMAVERNRAASLAAARAGRERDSAQDALDALTCGVTIEPTLWPCMRSRGHRGEHECPVEMRRMI